MYLQLLLLAILINFALSLCPYNATSDGQGSCYRFIYTNQGQGVGWNASNAEKICMKMGGHLVSIQDSTHNNFILGLATSYYSGAGWWLGATCVNGNWLWLDGSPMNYTNFASTYDSTCRDDIDCLRMGNWNIIDNSGSWNRDNCSKIYQHICRIPEITETQNGPCPTFWTYFAKTNSCYIGYFNPTRKAISDSRKLCQDSSAQLASVHSQEEALFLANLTTMYYYKDNYEDINDQFNSQIGLSIRTDIYGNSTFSWDDGSEVDFPNWYIDQPWMLIRRAGPFFIASMITYPFDDFLGVFKFIDLNQSLGNYVTACKKPALG